MSAPKVYWNDAPEQVISAEERQRILQAYQYDDETGFFESDGEDGDIIRATIWDPQTGRVCVIAWEI